MTTEIQTKLDSIIGKSYNYRGKNITIERYKEVHGTNCVVFTPSPINLLNSEIPAFLDSLCETSTHNKTEGQILVPKHQMVTFEPTKENQIIKATLLETLEKLRTDPKYLPQASAICEVVNQMVQLQKNEIHMLGLINKFK